MNAHVKEIFEERNVFFSKGVFYGTYDLNGIKSIKKQQRISNSQGTSISSPMSKDSLKVWAVERHMECPKKFFFQETTEVLLVKKQIRTNSPIICSLTYKNITALYPEDCAPMVHLAYGMTVFINTLFGLLGLDPYLFHRKIENCRILKDQKQKPKTSQVPVSYFG